jgi:hypothetical protein
MIEEDWSAERMRAIGSVQYKKRGKFQMYNPEDVVGGVD